jgi:cytoskeletal protein RodZ
MLDKLADELKAAREKSGITLQQMAAKTRIDLKFLEAIDSGNFSFLPDLYVKAFIKQYAKVIGLDENETINRYELALDGKLFDKEEVLQKEDEIEKENEIEKPLEETVAPAPKQTFTDVSAQSSTQISEEKKRTGSIIITTIIGFAVIAVVVYFVFFNRGSEIIVEEKPFEEVLEQTNQRYIEDSTPEPETVAIVEDSLELQITNITSTDSAWVLIIYDESLKEDFLLFPNSGKTIKAKESFKLTLGNSGVISLSLDNQPMEFEGRRGSVRHFKLDRNGIERLFSPPTLQ